MTNKEIETALVLNITSNNPIALKKAKIVNNFGLSGCNKVNEKESSSAF